MKCYICEPKVIEYAGELEQYMDKCDQCGSEFIHVRPVIMKQNNPKDQATVILMALEGQIDNMKQGIQIDFDKILQRINDLRFLLTYLPEKW